MMRLPDFSRRAVLVEKMDSPECDQAMLLGTVRRFELSNLLFTRYRKVMRRHILADMRRQPGHIHRLTDLGAGGGDVVRWMVRVCRRENLKVAVRAIEQDARIVEYARKANADYPEIEVCLANACDPASWGAPDYLFAQHFVHHLSDEVVIRLLADMDRVAGRGFVVNDLSRSQLAYVGFGLVAGMLGKGTYILEDGLVSIRRGFREEEIRRMVEAAGLKHACSIYSMAPSRVVVVGGAAMGRCFCRSITHN
jgi:2-polyprenyl-3-methyl-5-hydroxy-6-metoxy-1,4-benzoquinol methylase